MTTLQSLDRTSAETTAEIVARLPAQAGEPAPPAAAPARARPTCTWLIDAQSGRPVARWVVR